MPLAFDAAQLPKAYDLRQARIELDRLAAAWTAPEDSSLPDPTQTQALLTAIFGNSPYLSQLVVNEAAHFFAVLADGPDAVFNKLLNDLAGLGRGETDESSLMRGLRQAKRRAHLTIAVADIIKAWPLEQVTSALSDFADAAVQSVVSYLLRAAHAAEELDLPHPEQPAKESGLVILGLGKLGARELNYSSDIDLIVLFDLDIVRYRGRKTARECFVKLARNLVRLLQDSTQDGYVLRVDLRLRPDPASTPLAMSTVAAETYYEGMGQNWERAAMIKARAIAGDLPAGDAFLANLRPFIWRKHLDFAAIQDIHSIKRQIHAVKGHREIAVGGHNIKIGRGGIREIEFFAQTQQLIWGGRNPELRLRQTCEAISQLVSMGRTSRAAADDLIAAYGYLRHVEHRLQMLNDQQTQTLPAAGPELDRLALFCGHADTAEFSKVLLHHLGQVEDHYADLFEEAPSLGEQGNLVFTGKDDDPATVETLERMGFPDGSMVSGLVRAWHHGRYRSTRSARARELLTELMPKLLEGLGKTADPDTAFRRFDGFMRALPAGVQIFSLLHSNPELLDLIADVMGSAPLLADHLSRYPMLLDGVLTAGFFEKVPERGAMTRDLKRQLSFVSDFQDQLSLMCRWTKDRQFQIGVRLLKGVSNGNIAGSELSDVADAVIGELFPLVVGEFERQHGKLPGRGLAVVALGKLGSREMTVTSDLDLIFVYDIPEGIEGWDTLHSDGARPLAPIQYYARLAQRLITALTAMTGDGKLYDVDMRLRPSGNSGPIASGLQPFERYQLQEAWTWEHMALTRARPIAGDEKFQGEIAASLRRILTIPRDPEKLRQDVVEMRDRMAQQHRGESIWDFKHHRGGLVDIDFIAQYLMLRHGHEHPQVLRRNPADALTALLAVKLLDDQAADRLVFALTLWRQLQQMIRLLVGEAVDEAKLRPPTAKQLAKCGGCPDFSVLKALMQDMAFAVHNDFRQILGVKTET
ncbi:MAG TPA: bifunctional [glutamine synthetase] adenylyltransferase/[glutamine synthetase]-adenylyl-L-tyrosine phosphorylase [Dongiaceae bacterium]|nr:bifunctional [glutamine synthetase] adenylyltransferase/[glutamine synthetase]-adenylyl-L-tyrosine phosphorylase [Dongiaceae bacterium]